MHVCVTADRCNWLQARAGWGQKEARLLGYKAEPLVEHSADAGIHGTLESFEQAVQHFDSISNMMHGNGAAA